MPNERVAVIDVETTGLSPWRNDRVLEIAIVVISTSGEVQQEYDTLVNPDRDVGPSRIHRIAASDIAHAPKFEDIAGDVLSILQGVDAIAGHNVSFDKNFLLKEYERIGAMIPDFSALCTCQQFGRSNLQACCSDLDIEFDGLPHRALSDARATARVVEILCAEDPRLIRQHRLGFLAWPPLQALGTPCFQREHAEEARHAPPRFLQRLAGRMQHDVEATAPNTLAYMALIDRVLEDRVIDDEEENALVDAALNWGMSSKQLEVAHTQYLYHLAIAALADGMVTDTERRDLHLVARLLGHSVSDLDAVLESASAQLATAQRRPNASSHEEGTLQGQRVCFTGELQGTLDGRPITRDLANTLASQAGLSPVRSVTKKLDLLVVADPNTQSGKAKKARKYGIRILSDAVFWKKIGLSVD